MYKQVSEKMHINSLAKAKNIHMQICVKGENNICLYTSQCLNVVKKDTMGKN